jgi:hypothetical protein
MIVFLSSIDHLDFVMETSGVLSVTCYLDKLRASKF